MAKTKDYFLWAAVNPGGSGGGGGETWTEELIWENLNPNVAQVEAQLVFGPEKSLKGYDFFKCVYKETLEDTNSLLTINDVREIGEWEACLTCGISLDNCRRVLIQSNGAEFNSINIENSITKTGETANTTNIILAIYGIKKG